MSTSRKFYLLSIIGLSTLPSLASDSGGPLAEIATDNFELSVPRKLEWSGAVEAGWRSRYVTQGVNNLEKGGIFTVNPTVDYDGFNFSIWYAIADSVNFQEVDLVASYPFKLGKFTIIPTYQQFFFFPDNTNSAVPAVTLEYQATSWLALGGDANVRISDGRGNGYYDTFIRGHWNLNEKWALTASALYGFNGGYVGGVSEGSETIDYRLAVSYSLAKDWKLLVSANYNQALSSLRHAELGDQFWYGVRLTWSF